MTEQQLFELKRIKVILSGITGLEDDDQENIEDAYKSIKTLINESAQPAPVQEPLEYWNAVEGWVKIDEVRQHFDSVGCGTIYKNAGEDRVPLYTAAQRKWVGLTDEELELLNDCGDTDSYKFARAIEAKLKEKNGGAA